MSVSWNGRKRAMKLGRMIPLRLQTARAGEMSQAKMIPAGSDTTVGARGMSNDLLKTSPAITSMAENYWLRSLTRLRAPSFMMLTSFAAAGEGP